MVDRLLPTDEAVALLELTTELADAELAPRVDDFEARGEFPRERVPHAGPGRPARPALPGGVRRRRRSRTRSTCRCSRCWPAAGWRSPRRVSVHTLSCYPVATYGTDAQRKRHLPDLLGGELLGAYCLSEPQGGSDAAVAADPGRARRRRVRGHRHQGVDHPRRGGRLLQRLLPHRRPRRRRASPACSPTPTRPGSQPQAREQTMGLRSSPVAQVVFDGARVPADRLIGEEGAGFRIAMSALDSGRLGIAACAVGLAQAALDYAAGYAREREQFGQRDRRLPGARLHARRHGHPGHRRPGADAARRPAARRRPPVPDRGGQGQAVRHRHRDAGHHRRGAGARRLRLRQPTTRSSGTCGRPRCCRSSRAPTRSSAW